MLSLRQITAATSAARRLRGRLGSRSNMVLGIKIDFNC